MRIIEEKNYKVSKKFCAYGVSVDIQVRFKFLDVKHFKH